MTTGLTAAPDPQEPDRSDVEWVCPRRGCDYSNVQPATASAVAAFHTCANGRRQSVELKRGEPR